jgi:WD40 repeat protein/serine/threonine protein kinase
MASSSKCARCGAPLEPTAQGLTCPACLIKAVLEESADTISTPPVSLPARSEGAARPERIGPYTILEQLGEGGMGVVYLAEQSAPIRRRVALKLIKLGMDTHQVVARFEAERQALALMDHPNIASVFDAGATEHGRPFFVMEYVPGVPITEFCDRHELSTRARLELFQQVCGAVQHAHQKGVIHRDLKPSNVLVIEQDGRPSPKVIDFGIAKATGQHLTEKTLFTEHGLLVGTPEYMSPEQADAGIGTIDTRTDIYSLGILLYELLVGGLPFAPTELRRAGYAEIQRIIREQEAPKPSTRLNSLGLTATEVATRRRTTKSTLLRELRGDLDWITLKAIEKAPSRRYASASEFAADIGRHLHNEPVLAGSPGAPYRLKKFLKKHRGAVAAGMALIGLLTLGLATSTALYVRAERSRQEAERQRTVADHQRTSALTAEREADRQRKAAQTERAAAENERAAAVAERDAALYQSYRNALLAADLSLQAGELALARRQLEATDPQFRGWEWRYLSRAAESSRIATAPFTFEVREVRFSAAGDAVFARGYDVFRGAGLLPMPKSTVTKVSWAAKPTTSRLPLGERVIAISPDGSRVLTAIECQSPSAQTDVPCQPVRPHLESDSTRPALVSGERVGFVVRETSTGHTLATLSQPNVGVWTTSRGLSRNLMLVTAGGSAVVVQDGSRKPIARLSGQYPEALGATFSADGTRLAAWSWDNVIHVWDLTKKTIVAELRGHQDGIRSAEFDATATRIVSTSFDGTTRVWSVTEGSQLHAIQMPVPSGAVFSRNGERIAIGTDSGVIQIVETSSGRVVTSLKVHSRAVSSVAWSPDSSRVVFAAAEDSTVRLWSVLEANQLASLVGHDKAVMSVAFSPDGGAIASGARDGTVRVWNANVPASVLTGHIKSITAVGFATSSGDVVSASEDGTVRVWNQATGELRRSLDLESERILWPPHVVALSMRPPRVAYPVRSIDDAASGAVSKVVDVSTGTSLMNVGQDRIERSAIHQVAISPDGTRMADAAVTRTGSSIYVWLVPSGRAVAQWKVEGGFVTAIAFSPDGRRIAVVTDNRLSPDLETRRGRIVIFEVGQNAPIAVIMTAQTISASPVFAPDGSRMAFGEGTKVRLWDFRSQADAEELGEHDEIVRALAISPDGTRLATAGNDSTVRIWDVPRHGLLLTIRVQALPKALSFSADGTQLAVGSTRGTIQMLDGSTVRAPGMR